MAVLNIVPVVLTGVACTLLYLTLPNRRVVLRDAALGGFLAAIGFEWMKHGFALYITQFATYKLVYGHSPACRSSCCGYSRGWWCSTGAVVAAVAPRMAERASQGEPAPGAVFIDARNRAEVLLWQARAKGTASPSRNYTRQ